MPRTAAIRRETAETKIGLTLNLDGSGQQLLLAGLGGPSGIALELTPVAAPSSLVLLGIGTAGVIGWAGTHRTCNHYFFVAA